MNRGFRSGLTIAELVLATAITSLVGLSVTGVFMTLSTAQAHSEKHYVHLQTARITARHMQAALRKAKLVAGASDAAVILWIEDTNSDGLINISEVLGFGYFSGSKELRQWRIVWPDTMLQEAREALDNHITLASLSDPWAARADIAGQLPSSYVEELLADSVLEFSGELDAAAPLTHRAKFRLKIGTAKRSETVYVSATLRDDETARVGTSGEDYVLTPPE